MRRTLLLASLLAMSAVVANSGCVPFGCGSFEGGGNRVYERDADMMILCENGGFVVALETEMVEGRFSELAPGSGIATRGEDGERAFELTDNGDGTASAPELGDRVWTAVALGTVGLHHSNALCNDLAYRAWWARAE
jgi:hypothetical protein